MKVSLEALPGELPGKAQALLEGLGKALREEAPEVADVLLKAAGEVPQGIPELRQKALRESSALLAARYRMTLDMMLTEIGQRLDRHLDDMGAR